MKVNGNFATEFSGRWTPPSLVRLALLEPSQNDQIQIWKGPKHVSLVELRKGIPGLLIHSTSLYIL